MAKKTYTYATEPKIKEKAEKKAKREKTTLSEKIDKFLREYVQPPKKNYEFGDVYSGNVRFSDHKD